MAPSDADDFEHHQWKSEFASSRSGRNSPNIFAKFRRKLLLSPPVRCARSPTLTEEELDALTGDLPYQTNYTYAYSKIYDPSQPEHWEVPNLTNGPSPRYLAEQEHWSAASLGRQLFYLLRFPVVLLIHVITYILEAFYHVIKISTYTLWDFLLYLIKTAKTRYDAWLDHRNRTALIRNRQDPFKVKAARFLSSAWSIISYLILAPVHFLSGRKAGVEQYEYKSIKDQLENERASRMMTRSQTLERSRKFEGLSQSPSRRAPAKQSTLTTITAKVFSSGGNATPTTSTVKTTRTVRERSVTPRFHNTRATRSSVQQQAFEEHEGTPEIDTPLSTYGLRSRRGMSHVNTPEPTFDIGQAAATSTPLFRNNLALASDESTFWSKTTNAAASSVYSVFSWILYLSLIPFLVARTAFYFIKDHAQSAYMKWTNFEPTPMEAFHVRAENEPADADVNAIAVAPWTQRFSEFFYSSFNTAKNLLYGFLALTIGAVQESVYFIYNLGKNFVNAVGDTFRSRKLNSYSCFGLLLLLLLALLLLGLRTPAAITENESGKVANDERIGMTLYRYSVKCGSYLWERFIDVVFEGYNLLNSIGRTIKEAFGIFLASTKEALTYIWKTILWIVFGAYDSGKGAAFWTKDAVVDSGNSVVAWFGGLFAAAPKTGAFDEETEQRMREVYEDVKTPEMANGPSFFSKIFDSISSFYFSCASFVTDTVNYIVTVLRSIPDAVSAFFIRIADYLNNFFYDYFWSPVTSFYKKFNFSQFTKPFINAARYLWSLVVLGAETVVNVIGKVISLALWLLTWPFAMMTRAWIHISNYAPEEVIQVIPIPQAVTPDPLLETLQKKVEVEDEKEELTIHPAPAPAPIPIPHEPPVIIHQTNVVETVDKEAIIKEVTEKLRAELSAELSAQFQQELRQELSAKFEANYNTLIEKLKVENTNIQIDNHHLEALIRQMIYEYDTDKTGKVDYALESSGGAVVTTRCSETYKSYTRLEKFWDIPIYYHHYSPRVVIQRNSKSLFPGECWCFKESRGYIAVELSHFIDVSSISYEHIGKEVAPEGNRSSAPKGILVWAYKQIDDMNSRVLIGDYTYSLEGPPLQFFVAKHKPDFPVKFVELEVTSNYGAQFTCLYRLRVHGKMIKM